MKHCLFIALLLTCACSIKPQYSHSFVDRFIDPSTDAGCIVFSTGNEQFSIEDNSTIRGRLYFDYNRESHANYSSFLFDLLNYPNSVIIPQEFKHDLFFIDKEIEKFAKENFISFRTQYLDRMGPNVEQVKECHRNKEQQILKACFDNGLFVFYSCIDARYYICNTPLRLPPILN